MERERDELREELQNELIEGRNAVIEALRAGRAIDKIFLAKGDVDKTLGAVRAYCEIADILALAAERGEAPFVVLCDEISDPHNLGAIIRTAECVGAHGVVIPKRRSAGLTAIVGKASAGAAEHMLIARVANLSAAIKELQAAGLWVYGTAADGACPLWKTDLRGPIALVIGSEGDGMSRLVKENCDFVLSLPMKGKLNSLNASAAAAVTMYEILRQRSLESK